MAGRRVADAAADVLAIADAYGLEKFSVVGRSGGGPHALACAALLPGRTTKVAVLVGLAPHGADGLDWFDGMAQSNVIEYTAAANGYEDIVAPYQGGRQRCPGQPRQPDRKAPGRTARPGPAGGGGSGHPVDVDRDYAEALRTSDYGWIDDVLAFCSPWGFDPASVACQSCSGMARVTFLPASHARWLADKIPSAAVVVQAGAAHFGALDVLPGHPPVAVRRPARRPRHAESTNLAAG